jgi:hypothetical protein
MYTCLANVWDKYDHKVNNKRCVALWDKLNKADEVKAYYGIDMYYTYLAKRRRGKADPENYFRSRMWENEWK